MRVLNVVLVLLMFLTIMQAQPNLGARVLNNPLRLESLSKGPAPPSGPSGCTYIPGSGGAHCPLKEMNVPGIAKHH
ncbi:hypothetical protein VNO78_19754 [Psophocarpus tetragonolobus]|uniref:Rapid ALkalinization Factor n=1 Tax=Psophocarpus tetragonolobus TaxID=3891 RepID=A0AAN9S843_PSOTE